MSETENQVQSAEKAFDPSKADPEFRVIASGWSRYAREKKQLFGGIREVPPSEHYSGELEADRNKFNARRAAAASKFTGLFECLLAVITKFYNPNEQNPELGELSAAAEQAKQCRLGSFAEAIGVAVEGEQIADRCAVELEPVAKQLQTEYEEMVERVKAEFEKMGSGLDTMPAYRGGREAGERQFTLRANENKHVKQAKAVATSAKSQVNAMKKAALRNRQVAEELRKELVRLTASEMRV